MENQEKDTANGFFSFRVLRFVIIFLFLVLVPVYYFYFGETSSFIQSMRGPTPTIKVVTDEESDIIPGDAQPTASSVIVQPIDRALAWVEPRLLSTGVISKEKTFDISLLAFSGTKDVTGYDILMKYDPEQLEMVSTVSLLEQYQVYQYDRKTHIAITGIKKLEENNPIVFDNTPIVKVTLKAKKSGDVFIDIVPVIGKEKTQFVDNAVNPYQPQPGRLTVKVTEDL